MLLHFLLIGLNDVRLGLVASAVCVLSPRLSLMVFVVGDAFVTTPTTNLLFQCLNYAATSFSVTVRVHGVAHCVVVLAVVEKH